jgi:hypothetical protein
MDQAPPEICGKIFLFACRDNGYTGRSSLVSKYIHETSKPVQLQSISLRGHDQMLGFAALLKRTPPHLRRVRNLLILSNDLDVNEDAAWARYHILTDQLRKFQIGGTLTSETESETETLSDYNSEMFGTIGSARERNMTDSEARARYHLLTKKAQDLLKSHKPNERKYGAEDALVLKKERIRQWKLARSMQCASRARDALQGKPKAVAFKNILCFESRDP